MVIDLMRTKTRKLVANLWVFVLYWEFSETGSCPQTKLLWFLILCVVSVWFPYTIALRRTILQKRINMVPTIIATGEMVLHYITLFCTLLHF